MTHVRTKICGITDNAALDAAIAARADFCGFVFFPPSARNLALSDAKALGERAGPRIGKVGLFVDADDREIADAIDAARLDALQLHGEETPDRVAQLKARFGLPIWKAVPVSAASDVERAKTFENLVDLILFDAKTPKDAALPGGMGLRFDWALLANHRSAVPWGLAGGLSPDNVTEAITLTRTPLVDTSSGVESAPGVKDVDKIAAFCKAARSV